MRIWTACATGALMLALTMAAHGEDRPVIKSASDMPPTSFTLKDKPSAEFLSDGFVTDTLPALKAEAERIRAEYDIADPALADELRAGLAAIALLERQPMQVAELVAQSRAAATKPQLRALGLLRYDALAATLRPDGSTDCSAGVVQINKLLDTGDARLRDEVLGYLTQSEVTSPAFVAGIVEAEMDPGIQKRGTMTLLEGLDLASYRAQATMLPNCRPAFSGAMRAWLADPKSKPADIWAARQPDAALLATARPVTVAVWDMGYDPILFPGQLAIDSADPLDGRDNDGNGVTDDWNGPSYGYRLDPMPTPLPPPSAQLADQLAFQMALAKGNADLRHGDDTAEAELFAARAREAPQAEQARDALMADEMATRDHGTQIASEIADGAPFVRLYNVAALPFGEDPRPVPLDEAQMVRWVGVIDAVANRLKGAEVRVVNMSWGLSADSIAQRLLRTGDETNALLAAARGKAMYAQAEAALLRLVQGSPNTLFVVGAGNSNQTDEIFAATPQTIHAPNLVVVGAAGVSGTPTGFTTHGEGVRLYAWGEGVPVRLPGGMRSRASGTAMAAPLVSRAAATMLAINPRLTPAGLIEGMLVTSTAGEDSIRLLNAGAAARWAKGLEKDKK